MDEVVLPVILPVALAVSVVTARALFFLVRVEGKSMFPTLADGDLVLACRWRPRRWLRKGRLIVWQPPPGLPNSIVPERMRGRFLIKRITGLPEETLTVSQESVFPDKTSEVRVWHIPPNHYFVQGELPGLDSREIGPIAAKSIHGLALFRLKPGSAVSSCDLR